MERPSSLRYFVTLEKKDVYAINNFTVFWTMNIAIIDLLFVLFLYWSTNTIIISFFFFRFFARGYLKILYLFLTFFFIFFFLTRYREKDRTCVNWKKNKMEWINVTNDGVCFSWTFLFQHIWKKKEKKNKKRKKNLNGTAEQYQETRD